MVKKGDTLIEVMLAVGIFSMIAIAITAVMSGGTSGAQTSLETTLAREEIDTQAEALRFIQSSYIADKDSSDKKYTKLWEEITKSAIELSEIGETNEAVLQYTPSSCAELYNDSSTDSIASQNAFIINPRALGTFTSDTIESVFMSTANNRDKFKEATIYPRLIYSNDSGNNESDQSIITNAAFNNLFAAEGIYIVAVRDAKTTSVIKGDSKDPSKTPAFYDFYIRTCWYGSNANDPSTISTVIRLYDPDAVRSSGE